MMVLGNGIVRWEESVPEIPPKGESPQREEHPVTGLRNKPGKCQTSRSWEYLLLQLAFCTSSCWFSTNHKPRHFRWRKDESETSRSLKEGMQTIVRQSESESHSVVSNSLQLHGLYSPWNSPGQNTGVGSLSCLQGIFPNQWSNRGLPHCGRILYQLIPKENPRSY